MKRIDLTGLKFGKLTVIKKLEPVIRTGKTRRIRSQWFCKCDCGSALKVITESLRGGNTKSCGCIKKDGTLKANYIHGESHGKNKTKEYAAWSKIKGRCYCETDAKYYTYGARGIKICDKWVNSFENFLSDMGRCPKDKYSIDRINNNGNYEPSNCKWSTRKEQARNKTNSVLIEMDGLKMNLSSWCEKLNLKYEPTRRRITNKNMALQKIINK